MNATRVTLLVAGALLPAACADFAIEPDQFPHSMVITPADTLITEGDQAKLTLVVRDIDLNPMPGPPSWAPPEWEVSPDRSSIDIASDGSVTALGGGDLRLIAKAAGLEAWATLRINPANIRLSAPAIYLNQAIPPSEGFPSSPGETPCSGSSPPGMKRVSINRTCARPSTVTALSCIRP